MFEDYDYSTLFFEMIRQVADKRKSIFIPVRLICDEEELVNRVKNPNRKKYFKKTSDFERSRYQARNQAVFKSNEIHEITINNTQLSPEAVVDCILEHINKIIESEKTR